MAGSNCETWRQICDDLGSNIQYSAGPVLTLNGEITANDYMDIVGSQAHPVVQLLLTNNDALFQDDSLPVHTARSVQSWVEDFSIFSGQHNCPS